MVDLALHYSSITPESIRTEYVSHLFGAGGSAASSGSANVQDPATALCFDLSIDTFIRKTRAGGSAASLFVVDTRPVKLFDLGHYNRTQWHLDAKLVGRLAVSHNQSNLSALRV